jgi:rhodanese-related sulfurtransferase
MIQNFAQGLLLLMLTSAIHAAEKYTYLDVRSSEEWQNKHLKDTQLMDFHAANFKDQLARLDKSKKYRIYCASGGRSRKAAEMMRSLGFSQVEDVKSVEEAQKLSGLSCDGKGCRP